MGKVILVIVLLVFFFADTDYSVVEAKHAELEKLCLAYDSVPKGYDQSHVTCENGLTVQYRELYELP